MNREFNVLALIKGQERYVFVYDDASCDALLDAFRLAGPFIMSSQGKQ